MDAINNDLPIISSKSHGGIGEILLNGKGGVFYNQGNYKELADKIEMVRTNYIKYLHKKNLAKQNLFRFTEKKNIRKFERYIDII